jgi:alpha-beta hydrolase superfamily lysophospholipase
MTTTEVRSTVTADDGYPIETYGWNADADAGLTGIVQIAHGMGEHSRRYRWLAGKLAEAGYATYSNEHRGHGADAAGRGELGDFGARGMASLVADMATLSRLARSRHPGVPLVLLGHSMGSFAAQAYLPEHSALIDGVILSGTAAVDLLDAGRSKGWKLEDANAAFANPRTPFDWLSRDAAVVDAYIADPLCGFTINPASRESLSETCARATAEASIARIRADLPLFGITGDHDAVNNNLEWFHPLLDRYRRGGMTNVSSHVYGGARHEVFNETNRDEVVANVVSWLTEVTGSGG